MFNRMVFNMKNIIKIVIVCILSLVFVSAIDLCEERAEPNTDCMIASPAGTTCSTIFITNMTDGNLLVNDGAMDVLNAQRGTYNYTFNFGVGSYLIGICDNSSSQIIMSVKNVPGIYDDITDITETGFFYRWWKTVFSWLGGGESPEERIATQTNATFFNETGVVNVNATEIAGCVWGDVEAGQDDSCADYDRNIMGVEA